MQSLLFDPASNKRAYLIVGNSHSKDTFNALQLNQDLFPDSQFARYAIGDRFHRRDLVGLLKSPNYQAVTDVVISTRYQSGSLDGVRRFAEQVRRDGKALSILGPSPEYKLRENLPPFDWYIQRAPADFTAEDLSQLAWQEREPVTDEFRAKLTQIAEQSGARLFWKEDLACDAEARRCNVMTPDGLKAHYDYGHYTLDGARWFGQRIHQLGWFEQAGDRTILTSR